MHFPDYRIEYAPVRAPRCPVGASPRPAAVVVLACPSDNLRLDTNASGAGSGLCRFRAGGGRGRRNRPNPIDTKSWLAISHHFIETSPMKLCPFCSGEMGYTVSICPHCGRDWLSGVSHGVPVQPVQRATHSNSGSGRSSERPAHIPALILFFLLLYLVGMLVLSALFDIH
jgi:hypothetical protein